MANVKKTRDVKLTYNYTTNDLKLMDKALDPVPHQMSGKGCDDYVTSATRSLIVDEMLENA